MNQETRNFITKHANDDLFSLKLRYAHVENIDIDVAIRQISGKQKIKNKIPLFHENDNILYPPQLSLEQSSSQATALYKASLCEGETLVDLTGGFGIDCYFMSADFKEVTYVERNAELCELARHNFHVLGRDQIQVICSEAGNYLDKMEKKDWIYMDPARRDTSGKKVVLLADCEPDVSLLSPVLLAKAGRIMVKLSPMMDLTSALKELQHTISVHVVSVDNECKEILLIMGNENVPGASYIQVTAINIAKNIQVQEFKFTPGEEAQAQVKCTAEVKEYLYEPHAALLKSGAFKTVGNRFGMEKLHINTHLYTSSELINDFPGRVFQVSKVWNSVRDELKRVRQANLTTRNYPVSANELRAKLKLKDGGDIYLFACTLANEQKVIIECRKAEMI